MDGDTLKINGLVIAGLADFKHQLIESGLLDTRLRSKLIAVVDTAAGMRQGLSEAIDETRVHIASSEYRNTHDTIMRFMQMIAEESPLAVYGEREVRYAVEAGVVETLIVRRGHELDTDDAISVDDRDATSRQFLGMGGIGAILRFPLNIPDEE